MERVPTDLNRALAAAPAASAAWKSLTPIGRRDFVTWIVSAKLPETRTRRIGTTVDKLVSGKRRPCCYAIVPMSLYKALAGTPKAKAQWKVLTPDARRDFADWIEEAKEPEERGERIAKACVLLATGTQRPRT
jgi:uncharacterized protein YdeI (YjbR/CyaY-like superfamily)